MREWGRKTEGMREKDRGNEGERRREWGRKMEGMREKGKETESIPCNLLLATRMWPLWALFFMLLMLPACMPGESSVVQISVLVTLAGCPVLPECRQSPLLIAYLSTHTVYQYKILFFLHYFGGYGRTGKWIQENIIFMRFCCCFKLSKMIEKLSNEQPMKAITKCTLAGQVQYAKKSHQKWDLKLCMHI